MTIEEQTEINRISEQLSGIADLLQTVAAGYDQRIANVERVVAEIRGRCELRGGQSLERNDNISSRFEHLEKRIDRLSWQVAFLILGNSIIFLLIMVTVLVLANPRWYAILLLMIRTLQEVR